MSGVKANAESAKYGELLDRLHKWRLMKESKSKTASSSSMSTRTKKPLADCNQLPTRQIPGDVKKRLLGQGVKMDKKIKLPEKANSSLPTAAVKPTLRKPDTLTKQKTEAAKAKEAAKTAELKQKLEDWKKKKAEEKDMNKQKRRNAFVPSSSKVQLILAESLPQLKKSQTLGTIPTEAANSRLRRRETFSVSKPAYNVPVSRSKSTATLPPRDKTSKATSNVTKPLTDRGFVSQASLINSRRVSMPVNAINNRRVSMPVTKSRPSFIVSSKPKIDSKPAKIDSKPSFGSTVRRTSPRLNAARAKIDTSTGVSQQPKISNTRKFVGSCRGVPVPRAHKKIGSGVSQGTRAGTTNQRSPKSAVRITPHRPVHRAPTSPKRVPAPSLNTKKIMAQRIPATKPSGRPPWNTSQKAKPQRSVSAVNITAKNQVNIKKTLRRAVSDCAAKTTKTAPRKSILKTPRKQMVISEEGVVEVRGAGVRFDVPLTPLGTPPRTPGTPNKRKAAILTPQMARRNALNMWLISKGKTPTRFRHLCCFDENTSAKKRKLALTTGLDVHELTQQQNKLNSEDAENIPVMDSPVSRRRKIPAARPTHTVVTLPETDQDRLPLTDVTDHTYHGVAMSEELQDELTSMLEECTILFDEGCPAPSVMGWLDDIAKHFPGASSTAEYWICRANVVEEMEDDHVTVDVYEQACRHNAQPAEDIAEALKQFVIRMDERSRARKQASRTPCKRRPGIEDDNVFESSSIKYCLTNTTPFFKKLHKCADEEENVLSVITPVRRSTRRSTLNLPDMLRDHDMVVDHLDDIPTQNLTSTLYMPNDAITDDKPERTEEEVEQEYHEVMEDKENIPPLIRDLCYEFEEAQDENNS